MLFPWHGQFLFNEIMFWGVFKFLMKVFQKYYSVFRKRNFKMYSNLCKRGTDRVLKGNTKTC